MMEAAAIFGLVFVMLMEKKAIKAVSSYTTLKLTACTLTFD
jgi:hypothetical protein